MPFTDFASRYLLVCEALSTTKERYAITIFERLFQDRGLPAAIRTDKRGAVCLSPRALRLEQIVGVVPSARPYQGLTPLDYPLHDWTAAVTTCGRICWKGRKVNVSQVFAGQAVGVRQVGERIWLVTFMEYDLGYFDDETCRLEPIANPFGPKLLPMSPE